MLRFFINNANVPNRFPLTRRFTDHFSTAPSPPSEILNSCASIAVDVKEFIEASELVPETPETQLMSKVFFGEPGSTFADTKLMLPVVRCGTSLTSTITLHSSFFKRRAAEKIETVEFALQWKQWSKVHENVPKNGTIERTAEMMLTPYKATIWDDVADQQQDIEEDIVIKHAFHIPLGLGPTYVYPQRGKSGGIFSLDIAQDVGPSGYTYHVLQVVGVLEPVCKTRLGQLFTLDWKALMAGTPTYYSNERVVLGEQQLWVLPSLSKRTHLLSTASPAYIQNQISFSISTHMLSLASAAVRSGDEKKSDGWFSAEANKVTDGFSDDDSNKYTTKYNEQDKNLGDSSIALSLASDVLIAEEESLSGRVEWENRSSKNAVTHVDLEIHQRTKFWAQGEHHSQVLIVFEQRIFEAKAQRSSSNKKNRSKGSLEFDVRVPELCPFEQRIFEAKAQRSSSNKKNRSKGSLEFDVRVPELTPTFETDVVKVHYRVVANVHYENTPVVGDAALETLVLSSSLASDTDTEENRLRLEDQYSEDHKMSEGRKEGEETSQLSSERRTRVVRESVDVKMGDVASVDLPVPLASPNADSPNADSPNADSPNADLDSSTLSPLLSPAALYAEAVSMVEHRRRNRNKETEDDTATQRFALLRALRLVVQTGGSWSRFERMKASKRRSDRRRRESRGA